MLTFTVELDGGMLRAGGETGVGSDAILADVPVETGERLTKMEVWDRDREGKEVIMWSFYRISWYYLVPRSLVEY